MYYDVDINTEDIFTTIRSGLITTDRWASTFFVRHRYIKSTVSIAVVLQINFKFISLITGGV